MPEKKLFILSHVFIDQDRDISSELVESTDWLQAYKDFVRKSIYITRLCVRAISFHELREVPSDVKEEAFADEGDSDTYIKYFDLVVSSMDDTEWYYVDQYLKNNGNTCIGVYSLTESCNF